jgi:hypothetical protein
MYAFVMYTAGIVLVGILSSTLAMNLRIADLRLAEKESDYERLEQVHAAILPRKAG